MTTWLNTTFQLDTYGLILKGIDGGDSCSNVFTALYCGPHSQEEQVKALSWLVVDGIPRRHPDPLKWYSATNTTSRDQLTPYLIYLASHAPMDSRLAKAYFKRLAWQHAKHAFLLAWNTRRNFMYPTLALHEARSTPDVQWNYSWKVPDICGPDIWSIYIRGLITYSMWGWLAWPLLWILDLAMVIDTIWLYAQASAGRKIGPTGRGTATIDHDRRNATLIAHFSATNSPTLLSKLVWRLQRPWGMRAAISFWTQPEEPPVYKAIALLD
jgi:hypothetical protein